MIVSSLLVICNVKSLFSFLIKKFSSGGSCDHKRGLELSTRGKKILNNEDITLYYLAKCVEQPFNPTNRGVSSLFFNILVIILPFFML